MTLRTLDYLPENLREDSLMARIAELIDYITRINSDETSTREDVVRYNERVLAARDAINAKGEGFDPDNFLAEIDANRYIQFIASDAEFPDKKTISHLLPRLYNLKGTERGLKMLLNSFGIDVDIYSWADLRRGRYGSEILENFRTDFPDIQGIGDYGLRVLDREIAVVRSLPGDAEIFGLTLSNDVLYSSIRRTDNHNSYYWNLYDTTASRWRGLFGHETTETYFPFYNDAVYGMWSNGTTLWIVNATDLKVNSITDESPGSSAISYTRSNLDSQAITLHADNSIPRGIWSDGTANFYVSDTSGYLFVYDFTTKAFKYKMDLRLPSGSGDIGAIWSTGTTMWIHLVNDQALIAYNLMKPHNNKWNRDIDKEFDYAENTTNVIDMFSDGSSMWLLTYAHLTAYTLSNGERNTTLDKATIPNTYDAGTVNGNTLWLYNWVDSTSNVNLHAYSIANTGLNRDNSSDVSIASSLMYVAGNNDTAYSLASGSNASIWSNGTTVWALSDPVSFIDSHANSDTYNQVLVAYNMSDGSRDVAKDIVVKSNQTTIIKIWSNGTTMFAMGDADRIYAYNLSDGARDEGNDVAIDGITGQVGISSNEENLFVATDEKIYAYDITSVRNTGFDILLHEHNDNVGDIAGTSDGRFMYVVDRRYNGSDHGGTHSNGRIFTYDIPQRELVEECTVYCSLNPRGNVLYFGADGTQVLYDLIKTFLWSCIEVKLAPIIDSGRFNEPLPASDITDTLSNQSLQETFNEGLSGMDSNQVEFKLNDFVDNLDSSQFMDVLSFFWQLKDTIPSGLQSQLDLDFGVNILDIVSLITAVTIEFYSDLSDRINTTQSLTDTKSIHFNLDGFSVERISMTDTSSTQSYGENLWVADSKKSRLTAYKFQPPYIRVSSNAQLQLGSSNDTPKSLCVANNTAYVLNTGSNKRIHTYNILDGSEGDAMDLHPVNDNPTSIYCDGARAWVINSGTNNDKIYVYNVLTGERDSVKEINSLDLYGNTNPIGGVSIVEDVVYVANVNNDALYNRLYTYKNSVKSHHGLYLADAGFSIDNSHSIGLATINDGMMYKVVHGSSDAVNSGFSVYVIDTRINNADSVLVGTFTVQSIIRSICYVNGHVYVLNVHDNKVYAVNVNTGVLDTDKEIDLGIQAQSIWANEATLYVLLDTGYKVQAYRLIDGSRDESNDFYIPEDRVSSVKKSLWSNGRDMYVSGYGNKIYSFPMPSNRGGRPILTVEGGGITTDSSISFTDGKTLYFNNGSQILAHDLLTGDLDTSKQFNLDSGNANPVDGIVIGRVSILDSVDLKIYRYLSGVRQASNDLTLRTENANPASMWQAKEGPDNIWVSDSTDNKVYVTFDNSGIGAKSLGVRLPFDYTLDGQTRLGANGIWSNGTTIWVVNCLNRKAFAYNRGNTRRDTAKDFTYTSTDAIYNYMWSDGTTAWIVTKDIGSAPSIRAYTLSGGSRDSDKDITLNAGNSNPHGIWSNGETMWVADQVDNKLYAYSMSDGSRDTTKEFRLHADNVEPRGIWSNGRDMYVVDVTDNKVYAYNLSDGNRRVTENEFNFASNNGSAAGIWGDEFGILYVVDFSGNKIFTYQIFPDINLVYHPDSASTNNAGYRMWSDTRTMWVATYSDDDNNVHVYAYTLLSGARDPAKDLVLDASDSTDIELIWSNGFDLLYRSSNETSVYSMPTNYKGRDIANYSFYLNKSRVITAGITNVPGQPNDITSDGDVMWVADYATNDNGYRYNTYLPLNLSDPRPESIESNYRDGKLSSSNSDARDVTIVSGDIRYQVYYNDTIHLLPILFVLDGADRKLYAYKSGVSLENEPTLDITLPVGNYVGFHIYGNIIYALIGNRIRFYTLAGVEIEYRNLRHKREALVRDSDKDIPLLPDNLPTAPFGRDIHIHADVLDPSGICVYSGYIYVVDRDAGKVIRYNLSNRERDESYSFRLAPDNTDPVDIWRNSSYIYVSDRNQKIFAYSNSGVAQTANHISYTSNEIHAGIWSDATTIWSVNVTNKIIEGYDLITKARALNKDIQITDTNNPYSLCGHIMPDGNSVLWVTDGPNIFAYNTYTKQRDINKDIIYHSLDVKIAGIFAYQDTFLILEDSVKDVDGSKSITLYTDDYPEWPDNRVQGIHVDNNTLWVSNSLPGSNKIVAFDLMNRLRDKGKDIELDSKNLHPGNIIIDDDDIWVIDSNDLKVYNYTYLNTFKGRDRSREFTLSRLNTDPWGIWSNGKTIWVSDATDRMLYAYDKDTGERQEGKEITLHADNANCRGIWSNGEKMYVTDLSDRKLYVYNHDGTRLTTDEFDLHPDNNRVLDIWSNGTIMYVGNRSGTHIFAYEIGNFSFSGTRDQQKEFNLHVDNSSPTGLYSNGTTMWVMDRVDHKIYAYTLSNGVADTTKDITLDADNDLPYGIWSDGTTMWVVNTDSSDLKLYAYTLATKARDATKEFNLHADNADPRTLWSNGTTIWVVDGADDKLYAYTLAGGNRDSDKDITLNSANANPTGMYSDGTTIWVADNDDNKVYAYTLATKARDESKEFNLVNVSNQASNQNTNPFDIWSDGKTMWVADGTVRGLRHKLFAYQIMSNRRTDLEIRVSSNSGAHGIWSDGSTIWTYDGGGDASGGRIIRAYNFNGERNNRRFVTDVANANISAMWSDGDQIYVLDYVDNKFYVYTRFMDIRNSAEDLHLNLDSNNPTGIALGDNRMWILDGVDKRIYSYHYNSANYARGTRDVSREILLDAETSSCNPSGMYYDDDKLFISCNDTTKVFAYNLDGTRAYDSEYNLTTNNPVAISKNDDAVYVADNLDNRVQAYTDDAFHIRPISKDLSREFELDGSNTVGITANATTAWLSVPGQTTLYARNLSDGLRDTTKDISNVPATLKSLWNDNEKLYAVADGRINAYNIATADIEDFDGGELPRVTGEDIDLHDLNADSNTIWSDGTTMWVVDIHGRCIHAYTLATGARDTDKEFRLDANNNRPVGVWSDGTTIWIVQHGTYSAHVWGLYAYTLATGNRDTSKEVGVANGYISHQDARSIWSNGTILWVTNRYERTLFAYRLSDWSSVSARNITLHADNSGAYGITSDGTTMWVVDRPDAFVYAYNLSNGNRDTTKEWRLSPTGILARGIWTNDGNTFYVNDNVADKVYVYRRGDLYGQLLTDDSFDLHRDNSNPYGISSNGNIIYVSDLNDGKIYAYNKTDGSRIPSYEFNLHGNNRNPTGIWSNNDSMWVADYSDRKFYAYDLSSRIRNTSKEFDMDSSHESNNDIWSNGSYMYAVDGVGNKVHVYSSITPVYDRRPRQISSRDIKIYGLKHYPIEPYEGGIHRVMERDVTLTDSMDGGRYQIWFDGILFYTLSSGRQVIRVYSNIGERIESKDLNLEIEGLGLWSDGTTMWVIGETPDINNAPNILHAYTLATGSRDTTKEFSVSGSNGTGIWSDGVTLWINDLVLGVIGYTLSNGSSSISASVSSLGIDGVIGRDIDGNDSFLYAYVSGTEILRAYNKSDLSRSMSNDITVDDVSGKRITSFFFYSNLLYVVYSDSSSDSSESVEIRCYGTKDYTRYLQSSEFNYSDTGNFARSYISRLDTNTGNQVRYSDYEISNSRDIVQYRGNDLGVYQADKDIELSSNNSHPLYICTDSTTMWVCDVVDRKLYAYTIATGLADTSKDIPLDISNTTPKGLWCDSSYIYVADDSADQLFAYNKVTKARTQSVEINLANTNPSGIWSDGERFYVADFTDKKIYTYKNSVIKYSREFDITEGSGALFQHAKGTWANDDTLWIVTGGNIRAYTKPTLTTEQLVRDATKDFTGMPFTPIDIWSDGTTMWMSNDTTRGVLFAYRLSDMTADASKNINITMVSHPRGIWSNGFYIWVVDTTSDIIRCYDFLSNHKSNRDITIDSSIDNAFGIWSDGVTMWLSDEYDRKLYGYSMPIISNIGGRQTTNEFSLGGNTRAWGIWSNRDTMWVTDGVGRKLQAYNYTSKARETSNDIDLIPANADPHGMHSDGTTIWVSDATDNKAYAYVLNPPSLTRGRDTSKEFNLIAGNTTPRGIWSDGTTLWVADSVRNKLYAYTLATKLRDESKEFNLDTNSLPTGIWSNGTTMWVTDWTNKKISAYTLATKTRDSNKDVTLHSDNHNPTGLWSNGTTMWVTDWTDKKLYAYTLATKARDATKDITLDTDNDSPYEIWSNGTTMWVVDDTDGKPYAYNLSNGNRDATKDITLHSDNSIPYGIWSNGTTVWVADVLDNKIYAYNVPSISLYQTRDATKDITYHADNSNPTGIWSNGTTLWVADNSSTTDKVFAYTLSNGDRDTTKEINNYPGSSIEGIWSNGTTLWVADREDDKVYAYRLSDLTRDTGLDFNFHTDNDDTRGVWSDGTNLYVVDQNDRRVYAYDIDNVTPATRDADSDINLPYNLLSKGLFADGGTMFIVDSIDSFSTVLDKPRRYSSVYLFNTPGRGERPSADIDLHSDNTSPYGIFGKDEYLYVVDAYRNKFFVYNKFTGSRISDREFDLHYSMFIPLGACIDDNIIYVSSAYKDVLYAYNIGVYSSNIKGAWSDDETIWTLDGNEKKLIAYGLSRRNRISSKDIHVGNMMDGANSIWFNGTTAWVSRRDSRIIESYKIKSLVAEDFNLTNNYTNSTGIWSNGSTIWVLNADQNRVNAYNALDKTRDPGKDISLYLAYPFSSREPRDIWSNGTTMYVLFGRDRATNPIVVAYTLSSRTRDQRRDLSVRGNGQGICSDGETLWVLDREVGVGGTTNDRLEGWNLNARRISTSRDIVLHADNELPVSCDYYNGHIYVIDKTAKKVFVYDAMSKARVTDLEFNLYESNSDPSGIFISDRKVLVTDALDNKVYDYSNMLVRDTNQDVYLPLEYRPLSLYATDDNLWVTVDRGRFVLSYAIPVPSLVRPLLVPPSTTNYGSRFVGKDMILDSANSNPYGIWSNGEIMWVIDIIDRRIYAYQIPEDLYTTALDRLEDRDIVLHSDNGSPTGIGSDGTTMWVADSSDDMLYAYTLSNGTRDSSKDVTLYNNGNYLTSNTSPTSIFVDNVDGETRIRVADRFNLTCFTYRVLGPDIDSRDTANEFTFHPDNYHASGMWSNGEYIWIVDNVDNILYVNRLSDGVRDTTKEFRLHSDNGRPQDIWCDGETAYILDGADDKIYAYSFQDFQTTPRNDSKIISHTYNYPTDDTNVNFSNAEQGAIWGMGGSCIFIEYPKEDKLLVYKFTPSSATATGETMNYNREDISYFSRLDEEKEGNLEERDLNNSPAMWGNSNILIYEEE